MNKSFQGSIAPLTNVVALAELMERLQARHNNMPGMATFYGPSGYGKSTAMTWCVNRYNAYHVAVRDLWRPSYFCEAILREMGIAPARGGARMMGQVAEQLAKSRRILVIDEADYTLKNNIIDTVRDIYEASYSPVILIGEVHFPKKLERRERVHGRMMDWVRAHPADLNDCKLLAGIYCPGIEIDDEVLTYILQVSDGSARRITTNSGKMFDYARLHQLGRITMDEARKVEVFTGEAPSAVGF